MRNQDGNAMSSFHGVALVGGLLCVIARVAAAAAPMETPGIPGEGAVHPLPQAAYQPQKDATYHVVFALTKAGDSLREVSPSLQRVARAVNLYVSAGVDVTVCGQAVLESGFDDTWISRDVRVALSALTTITVLQQQGYALMPL